MAGSGKTQINIGGTKINIVPPKGFCEIKSTLPETFDQFKNLTNSNLNLLTVFLPDGWGSEAGFSRWATIDTKWEFENLKFTKDDFDRLSKNINRIQGEFSGKKNMRNAFTKEELLKNTECWTPGGVIFKQDNMFGFCMFSKCKIPTEVDEPLLYNVDIAFKCMSFVLIDGKIIVLTLGCTKKGNYEQKLLKTTFQKWAETLLEENKRTPRNTTISASKPVESKEKTTTLDIFSRSSLVSIARFLFKILVLFLIIELIYSKVKNRIFKKNSRASDKVPERIEEGCSEISIDSMKSYIKDFVLPKIQKEKNELPLDTAMKKHINSNAFDYFALSVASLPIHAEAINEFGEDSLLHLELLNKMAKAIQCFYPNTLKDFKYHKKFIDNLIENGKMEELGLSLLQASGCWILINVTSNDIRDINRQDIIENGKIIGDWLAGTFKNCWQENT